MIARRAGLLLTVPLLAVVFAAFAAEPKADAPPPKDPLCPAKLDDTQFAVATCASCHNADPKTPADHPFAKKYASHEFIRLSEGKTWLDHDPHQMAFKALTGERGKKMGEALKYAADAKTWSACLTCHAVDKLAGDTLHPDAAKEEPGKRFATGEGVACVGCHGVRKSWQTAHYEESGGGAIPWRAWDVEAKRGHGMRDLRNPAVKAKLCASCHAGSADLGRVVTHDMYAAGHPPLPPFELATYLDAEPRHWSQPKELPYLKALDSKTAWEKFHFHAEETAAAREFAAGAVAAVRAEAEMLAADARKGDGIDFARFDCTACHHDLKADSDRQKRPRGPDDPPPGRPALKASVGILAEVVAKHATTLDEKFVAKAKPGEFGEKWAALRKAATAKPFGDDTVADTADAVRAWCDGFLNEQGDHDKPIYDADATKKLREAIAARVKDGVADPEAGLALAWGYIATGGKEPPAEFEVVLPASVRAKGAKAEAELGYKERQEKLNKFGRDEFTKAFGMLK